MNGGRALFLGVVAGVASLWAAPPAGWPLTFSDEFNADRLDPRKWFTRYLGFRDPVGEGEARYTLDREHGWLILTVQEGEKPSGIQTAQGDYHQAKYRYDHFEPHVIRFDQCYGYFEIRAKMKVGTGAATFWLNKSDPDYYHDRAVRAGAPARGPILRNVTSREIDIGENYKRSKYNFHILGAVAGDVKKRNDYGFDFSADFHTYALDWRPGEISLYVDGELRERTASPRVPDSPMFVYLTCYNMLNVTWQPEFTVAEQWPRHFIIDYIRVYQHPDWVPPRHGPGSVEAEALRLFAGYRPVPDPHASGGARIEVAAGRGLAELEFAGPAGVYDLQVRHFEAREAKCTYRLWAIDRAQGDYRVVGSWTDAHGDGGYHLQVLPQVALAPGVVLRFEGTCDEAVQAHAALDQVRIVPAGGAVPR